jgi:hypothetical protein
MNLFDIDMDAKPTREDVVVTSASDVDAALTAQLLVAWAGEKGEESGLGWWRSDLVSEFGGVDLFRRLVPHTWEWAVLQGAREVARRKDAELRRQDHDHDRIVSLFSLGFELDERINERLQDLKRSGREPGQALPDLAIMREPWDSDQFWAWVAAHGQVETVASAVGRRLKGNPPADVSDRVRRLVAGLAPASNAYPLPHYRRAA